MKNNERWHYRGKYRGLFRLRQSGTTHAAAFYDLKLIAIEIRDVIRIPSRDPIQEKTGDYHFIDQIKPKSKWGLGGVDLVIIKDQSTAFSEKIFDVILSRHSGERTGFSPVRELSSLKTTEMEHFIEGDVFFSLPGDPPAVKAPEPTAVPLVPEVQPIESIDPGIAIPNLVSDNGGIVIPEVPVDLQQRRGCFNPVPFSPFNVLPLQQRRGCLNFIPFLGASTTLPAVGGGCLNPGGCLGRIFRLFRWLLIIYFALYLFSLLSVFLSKNLSDNRKDTKEGNVQSEKPRLDPQQDTMAAQPWNYLVDHRAEWSDFIKNKYKATYTTSTMEFDASFKRHNKWSEVPIEDELMFFHDLYGDMYAGDNKKLDSLARYFSSESKRKKLDQLGTAEMVVTFVQEIPYVLVHDGTCNEAIADGGFAADYHAQGLPCYPNIFAGVQSPYEFAHNLKGDCDTRSLLAYTLLDKLGIGASVWISREYGHSILGVAVPANSSNYKRVSNTRYFATELTAKGFRVGMIAPEHTDMDNWTIVLTNR
jgi:hypothetical protein